MSASSYHDLLKSAKINYGEYLAVINYEDQIYKKYTYNELFRTSLNIFEYISTKTSSGEIIGILFGHHVLIPAIISAIHQKNAVFMFLNPNCTTKNNMSIVNDLKIHNIFAITDNTFNEFTSTDISYIATNVNVKLYHWSKSNYDEKSDKNENSHSLAYCIRTSGSTDIAKYVAVTHQSIYPNIINLASIFNIKSDDVIYFSTPMTFDPSMIELYLAVRCNAALMIAPNNVDIIFPHDSSCRITIWQTTPSKFIAYGNDIIRSRILSDDTSLRVLALGGEQIYYDLNKLMHAENKTEIFNLYGITEISCWGSISKINKIEFNEYNCLGEILSDTSIKVFNDERQTINNEIGNIFIGSLSRICLVGDEIVSCCDKSIKYINWNRYIPPNDIIWRKTGDIGIEIDGKIYFKGRSDRIVKRYGHKLNMQAIESTALDYNNIIQCICIWDRKSHSLLLFYTCGSDLSKKDFIKYLNGKLERHSIPDNIINLPAMPLNDHGKISLIKIMDLYKESQCDIKNLSSKTIFINLLSNSTSIDAIKDYSDRSFFDLGGTSIAAVQLASNFESVTGKSYPALYQSLIDSKCALIKIINGMDDTILNVDNKISNKRAMNEIDLHRKKEKYNKINVKILWKYDTGKCVDANVTLYTIANGDTYVLVGSHSGRVVVLNGSTGAPLLDMNMQSRIEAPIFCSDDDDSTPVAIFGCYDGSLCCISLIEFRIKWKVSLDAMIKSQVCRIENIIYAATYSGAIYKVDFNSGEIISFIKIGSKGISADVVCLNNDVFVATLDGICAKIDTNTDTVSWKCTLGSPIFAKPTIINNKSCVVFSEVNSKIHCFNVDTGLKMWTFDDVKGLIFSSCSAVNGIDSDVLVFGCHDRHTYSITCERSRKPTLDWKLQNYSEVYATPFLYDSYVISISTDGSLQIIDTSTGELNGEYFLPGEVFSSPAVKNNTVYVGCRDDNVYCMLIS